MARILRIIGYLSEEGAEGVTAGVDLYASQRERDRNLKVKQYHMNAVKLLNCLNKFRLNCHTQLLYS